jgi:Dullard-like phosphatase family protein
LFYFNCSFVEKIQNFFSNKNKIISLSSNNLNLLSIVLTYTISIDINLLLDYKILLTNIYPLIKENFLLEIRQILNYLKMNNIEFPNLKYLFLIKKILSKNNIEEFSEQYIINQLTKNSKTIVEYVKIIVNQMYKENYPNSKELLTIFYNISKIDNYCINNFYLNKVLKISNQNKSMINSNNNIKQYLNLTMKIPYINTPSLKKFSLVIDLDETLISLKLNNKNKGILKFRPYLFDFLNNLKPYYELISFTYGTKNYAEPIINEIESKKKYFDIKLFREHSIIIGKDFVKDISRIGRPMSKIVIVDNININYRLNQENGILIYPFYEDNFKFDKALLELKNILLEIYKKYDDIREGLLDFKDEIITKVSCNLDYL